MVNSGTWKHRYTSCGGVTMFRQILGGFGNFIESKDPQVWHLRSRARSVAYLMVYKIGNGMGIYYG